MVELILKTESMKEHICFRSEKIDNVSLCEYERRYYMYIDVNEKEYKINYSDEKQAFNDYEKIKEAIKGVEKDIIITNL